MRLLDELATMVGAVARYFFNIENASFPQDSEGTECASLELARFEAVRYAASVLHNHAATFWHTGDFNMTVTDETGLTLFVLQFAAVEAPAVHVGALARQA